MVNPVGLCDFDAGRSLVLYSPEDRKYFDSLIAGGLMAIVGEVIFQDFKERKSHKVEKILCIDCVVENNLFGSPEVPKGIIGKVAREKQANAYETGDYVDINGGAIRATPFILYRVKL